MRISVLVITAAWVGAIGIGLAVMGHYENTPGAAAAAENRWPEAAGLGRSEKGATLVMAVHPRCPCTRASMAALAEIRDRAGSGGLMYVLFTMPAGSGSEWRESELWMTAGRIPGVKLVTDEGGTKARLFGAMTSGHVAVYDARGELTYQGGITAARGHAGPSAGEEAALAALTGREPVVRTAPVFGCPLVGAEGTCPACPEGSEP